ncbi:MAG: radical SAM protein [Candidatus Omnitrophica bacterium]|nr:radical SAM protein [Candidatus Omnitrophota bacterium]
MRLLLVNPWIYDFACYDLFSKPIGFLKIAHLLKILGFSIDYIDCLDRLHPVMRKFKVKTTAYGCGNYYSEIVEKPAVFKDIPRYYKRYGMPLEIFKNLLKKIKKPDIILLSSGMTYWYKGVFEVIEILKNKFKNIPVILGGIYASLCFEHAQKFSGADVIFKENKIDDFLNLVSKILNKELHFYKDFKKLRPLYEIYPKLNYVSLRTSGGCPFRCSYCGWYRIERDLYQIPYEEVFQQIEYFYKKLKIRNFAFYDDALLYNSDKHIKPLLKLILKNKIKANFHTPNGLNAIFIDKELAYLLKKANFVQVRLGLETANPNRQKTTGMKIDNLKIKQVVKFLKDADFNKDEIAIYLMMGLPDQTFKEIEESIYFAHSLKVKVYLEEYSPVPGTLDYKRAKLSKDLDPLWHNNSVFPLYKGWENYLEFQKLKDLNHKLNQELN